MITVNAKFMKGICLSGQLLVVWKFLLIYKRIILFIGFSTIFTVLLYVHFKANTEPSPLDFESINPAEEGDNLPVNKKSHYVDNFLINTSKNLSGLKMSSSFTTKEFLVNEAIWNYAWGRCNSEKTEPRFNLSNGKFLTKEKLYHYFKTTSCFEEVYFVVIIFSNVADIKLRNQIRESWASIKNFNGYQIAHYFITPEVVSYDKTNNNAIEELLKSEREEYNDIIQLNITFDVREKIHAHIAAMETALHLCPVASYVAIVESDTFVNSPNIVNMLVSYSEIQENFLMCSLNYNLRPERQKSKPLFMSVNDFRGRKYPPHCSLQDGYIAATRSTKLMLACYYQMNRHLWYDNLYIGALLPKKLQLNVETFWQGHASAEMHQYYLEDMSEYFFLVNGDKLQKRLWVKFVQSSLLSIM